MSRMVRLAAIRAALLLGVPLGLARPLPIAPAALGATVETSSTMNPQTAGTGSGARAESAVVTIDNFSFSPAQLVVRPGTRVTWTNRDDIPHTVTGEALPRVMKSPPLDSGDSYAVTFDHPGRFAYFCSLHPHMQGIVVVAR